MKFNWLSLLSASLKLIPYVVAGIEQIHSDLPGADKKNIAMDVLNIAVPAAEDVAPQYTAAIDAAQQVVSSAIDGVKKVYTAAQTPTPATTTTTTATSQ